MKSIFVLSSILCFLFLTAEISVAQDYLPSRKNKYAASGTEFKSMKGDLKITFPTKFSVKSEKKAKTNILKAKCYVGKNQFICVTTIYRDKLLDHYNLAKNSVPAFRKSVNGVLFAEQDWNYAKGILGREALVSISRTSKIYYRVIFINQIQYQLIVVNSDGKIKEHIDDFFDSFEWLDN